MKNNYKGWFDKFHEENQEKFNEWFEKFADYRKNRKFHKKADISKELLLQMYQEDDLFIKQISEVFDICTQVITKLFNKYGIHIVKKRFKSLTIDELYKLYIEENLSTQTIGNMYGVSRTPIKKLLKKYNITRSMKKGYTGKAMSMEVIKRRTETHRTNIEKEIIEFLAKNGFSLVSNYYHSREKMYIKCNNCWVEKEISCKCASSKVPFCDYCGKNRNDGYSIIKINELCKKIDIFYLEKDIKLFSKNCNFKCSKDHCFKASLNKLLKSIDKEQMLCPDCRPRLKHHTLQEVVEICKKHNVTFLDDFFSSNATKYNFRCNDNRHYFCTSFVNIFSAFKNGTNGCAKCSHEKSRVKFTEVDKILKEKNIELLDAFQGVSKHYNLKCLKCGLKWYSELRNITQRNTDCPKCNKRKNEKLTGIYLQEIFPSANIKPFSLKEKIIVNGEIIRNIMYIDYKFEIDNSIVFVEYNGEQHYKNVFSLTEEKFKNQLLRDRWLREYCIENKIILLEIDGRKYTNEKIKRYLLEECKKLLLI